MLRTIFKSILLSNNRFGVSVSSLLPKQNVDPK